MNKSYDMEVARLKEWESMKVQMIREGSIILLDEHDKIPARGNGSREGKILASTPSSVGRDKKI